MNKRLRGQDDVVFVLVVDFFMVLASDSIYLNAFMPVAVPLHRIGGKDIVLVGNLILKRKYSF